MCICIYKDRYTYFVYVNVYIERYMYIYTDKYMYINIYR